MNQQADIEDGAYTRVDAAFDEWHLTYHRGRTPESASVVVVVERDGQNNAPHLASLTAMEAGALIDALLTLLPAAREHSTRIKDGQL